MTIKVVIDGGAFMPMRAHNTDAGLDLRSPVRKVISKRWAETIDTGVHLEIPKGYCGVLISKSGLNVKSGLTSTGLIDEGYTGSISVKLYNNTDKDYIVERGDKISQLVLMPYVAPELEVVDSLEETERGDSGFGSTGR